MSPESDPTKVYPGKVLRRAAVFGARKLQSDDPSERTDDRVLYLANQYEGLGAEDECFLIVPEWTATKLWS